MPRKGHCYWTRKLELDLIEFVRQRECIWKPSGNTNHHIQQKYKAYAEFAASLGHGFTARTVRDRWVNIRSTFNHNLRRVEHSMRVATSPSQLYLPCWPLWKPLQFLRTAARKSNDYEHADLLLPTGFRELSNIQVKEENPSDLDEALTIRQRGKRTDRPRKKIKLIPKPKNDKCKSLIDDLVKTMKPLKNMTPSEHQEQSYWFFGKHVRERLNAMREKDAESARNAILNLFDNKNSMDIDDLPNT